MRSSEHCRLQSGTLHPARRSIGRRTSGAGGAAAVLFAVLASAVLSPVRAQPSVPDSAAASPGGAPIERITVAGATVLGADVAERLLAAPFPAESLGSRLRRLGRAYADRGWFDVVFHPDLAPDGTLRLGVDEGVPARLSQVYLRGTHILPEPVAREILGLAPGDPFRAGELEARLAALAEAYARRGHLDAEATLERLEFTAEGVVVGIAVLEGERATLSEVTVQGNALTRAALVRRLAGLAPPQQADAARIREAPRLLRRSGLFATVEEPVLYRTGTPDHIGVVLRVAESPRRHRVYGAVGMARDPGRDRPYLTGTLDLAFRNIYGTGRDAALAWSRDARLGSRLALMYRERYLFGSPVDLRLDLTQTVRDSTSTWQTLGLAGGVALGANLTLELGGGLDRSVYHLGVQGNTLRGRGFVGLHFTTTGGEEDGGRYGSVGVRLESARRKNDLRSPLGEDRTSVRQTLWSGRGAGGWVLASRHEVAARIDWRLLESDQFPVPESELFEFGGATTLRGYREGQFQGDRVVFGGVEYRYGDRRGAQLYLFADAGARGLHRAGGVLQRDSHLGAGLGLRSPVASGLFDLSIGVGEERSIAGAKLHVAFVQRF